MKYTIRILLIGLLCLTACKQNDSSKVKEPSFKIKGFLQNNSAKEVYLYHRKRKIQTAQVVNDTFSFTGKVTHPVLYTIKADSITVLAELVVENSDFHVFITPDEVISHGGEVQGELKKYHKGLKVFQEKRGILIDSFLTNHKSYKVKKLLKDLVDISDEKYKYSLQSLSNIEAKPAKEHIFNTLIEGKNYSLPQLKMLKDQSQLIDASWAAIVSRKIETIKEQQEKEKEELRKKKMLHRRKAPIFTGESLQGNDLTSADVIRGKKLVLIDFWASWCGPCRQVTPQVKYLYQKYKDKGFDIITVSEDKNRQDWMNGIQQDGMLWHHIFDDDMRIAYMFNVLSIPYMILLDGQGGIIKDKISLIELEKELSKL